jgi:hypothetical protein
LAKSGDYCGSFEPVVHCAEFCNIMHIQVLFCNCKKSCIFAVDVLGTSKSGLHLSRKVGYEPLQKYSPYFFTPTLAQGCTLSGIKVQMKPVEIVWANPAIFVIRLMNFPKKVSQLINFFCTFATWNEE